MDFINIKAIVFAAAIGVAAFFITNPLSCGDPVITNIEGIGDFSNTNNEISDSEAMGFGFAAFLISSVLFHMKPELMGKLNKSDEDDNEKEN
jgi:hypothetical protein